MDRIRFSLELNNFPPVVAVGSHEIDSVQAGLTGLALRIRIIGTPITAVTRCRPRAYVRKNPSFHGDGRQRCGNTCNSDADGGNLQTPHRKIPIGCRSTRFILFDSALVLPRLITYDS